MLRVATLGWHAIQCGGYALSKQAQKGEEPMTKFQTVDEYIAAQPEAAQPVLECIRRTIRKALPRAEEVISYNIPAYKLPGGTVVFFAGWKRHYSIYPADERLLAAFRRELAPYTINRSTIQFPLPERVPVDLIRRIVKFRATGLAHRDRARTPEKS
jgi:uncharacterized protein YdhG (YjbR/CyaY superfamily)